MSENRYIWVHVNRSILGNRDICSSLVEWLLQYYALHLTKRHHTTLADTVKPHFTKLCSSHEILASYGPRRDLSGLTLLPTMECGWGTIRAGVYVLVPSTRIVWGACPLSLVLWWHADAETNGRWSASRLTYTSTL